MTSKTETQKTEAAEQRRDFDINDPSTFDLYDPFLHGSVTIGDRIYTGAAAVEALRRNSDQQQDRAADRANAERQAERARQLDALTKQEGPWLLAWKRAARILAVRKRAAEQELRAAIEADPTATAFVKVLVLSIAHDHGRQIAAGKNEQFRRLQSRPPGFEERGASGMQPRDFVQILADVTRDLAAAGASDVLAEVMREAKADE